jgi:hypothetical protein
MLAGARISAIEARPGGLQTVSPATSAGATAAENYSGLVTAEGLADDAETQADADILLEDTPLPAREAMRFRVFVQARGSREGRRGSMFHVEEGVSNPQITRRDYFARMGKYHPPMALYVRRTGWGSTAWLAVFFVGFVSSVVTMLSIHAETASDPETARFTIMPYLCILESTVTAWIFRSYHKKVVHNLRTEVNQVVINKCKALFESVLQDGSREKKAQDLLKTKLDKFNKQHGWILEGFFWANAFNLMVFRNWGAVRGALNGTEGTNWLRLVLIALTLPYTLQQCAMMTIALCGIAFPYFIMTLEIYHLLSLASDKFLEDACVIHLEIGWLAKVSRNGMKMGTIFTIFQACVAINGLIELAYVDGASLACWIPTNALLSIIGWFYWLLLCTYTNVVYKKTNDYCCIKQFTISQAPVNGAIETQTDLARKQNEFNQLQAIRNLDKDVSTLMGVPLTNRFAGTLIAETALAILIAFQLLGDKLDMIVLNMF